MLLDKLTKKEILIMSILWDSESPLSASEIKELSNEDLSIYTVQQVLQRLLKKDFIKVAQIIQKNKTFMRIYSPVLTQTDYIKSFINKKTKLKRKNSSYVNTTYNFFITDYFNILYILNIDSEPFINKKRFYKKM